MNVQLPPKTIFHCCLEKPLEQLYSLNAILEPIERMQKVVKDTSVEDAPSCQQVQPLQVKSCGQ